MARDGARFVMLGTPNQGSYSMVENLLGKGDTLRSLARLDVEHSLREVLGDRCRFSAARCSCCPSRGLSTASRGKPDGGEANQDFQAADTWKRYQKKVFDVWFGDHQVGDADAEPARRRELAVAAREVMRRRRCPWPGRRRPSTSSALRAIPPVACARRRSA
jgi:hypothetical protein